jgi:hypothetical protein
MFNKDGNPHSGHDLIVHRLRGTIVCEATLVRASLMNTKVPKMGDIVQSDAQNLSSGERMLYVVGGLALAAAAAKPRPNFALNVIALAAGCYLAWRGAEGYCPVKAAVVDPGTHLV